MRKSVIFLSNHLTVSDSAKDEFPLIFDHYLDVADSILSLNFTCYSKIRIIRTVRRASLAVHNYVLHICKRQSSLASFLLA